MKSKANVVLVHGVWAVTAVELPLSSPDDDIAVVRNALAAQKGPPPHEDGFLWLERAGLPQPFAADSDAAEARATAIKQKPLSIKSFNTKFRPPASVADTIGAAAGSLHE